MSLRSALLLLLLGSGLAACSSMGDFGLPGPVQSEFSRTLDTEYNNLADYQEQTLSNPKLAAYFRGKAAKARGGDMPLPDDPSSIDVPPAAKDEIGDAYTTLIRSLQGGSWIDNGAIAAMAQTRFDCWLAIQVMAGKPGAGEGCHEKFQEAMDLLKPQGPQAPTSYAVYFDTSSIAVNEAGMGDIRDAARALRGQPDWVIVLSGFTDPAEKAEDSRTLSIRRAMSVRNALAQQGVAMNDILVGKFGHAPEGKTGEADHERRVDIDIMPRAQAMTDKASSANDILPEHGSGKPVF